MRMGSKRLCLLAALLPLLGACEAATETTGSGSDTAVTPRSGALEGVIAGSDGGPIVGAEVTTEPATGSALSRPDGTWRLDGVGAGTYLVRVERPGFSPSDKAGVVVTEGGTTLVDFLLSPAIDEPTGEVGGIEGMVEDAVSGAPIDGATVSLTPPGTTALSGPGGVFGFTDLEPGTYTLTATKAGFEAGPAQTVVVSPAGTAKATLSLTEVPGAGGLKGRVVRADDGAPLAEAAVATVPASSGATTGPDGEWSIAELPSGTYTVRATKAGFEEALSESVVVTPGATMTVDLSLSALPHTWDSTCQECHLDVARVLEDLEDDPLPAPPGEGGSAGEG